MCQRVNVGVCYKVHQVRYMVYTYGPKGFPYAYLPTAKPKYIPSHYMDTLGVTDDKFQAATTENFHIMAHSTYQAGGEQNAEMQPLPFPGCL